MKNDSLTPAGFMEMVNGFRTSRVILTAHELGIFNLLGNGSPTSSEIARTLQADPRAVDRLLNALTALTILKKTDNRFSNTPFSLRFLVEGGPEFLGGLSLTAHTWKTWSSMTEVMFKGSSVVMDKPINERSEEWLRAFIQAMHARGVSQAVDVADMLDFKGIRKILDVGGGSGAFTFEFIRRMENGGGVILDLPAVIPITREYIEREGMSGSVSVIAGDYLTEDFGQGFDLVYLSAIIHINSPEENALLILKAADALNPGGKVVIMDHFMSDDRTEPLAGALFAMNMLVGTKHGDTYTERETRTWMEEAGLKDIRRKDSGSGTSIMTGKK